MQSSTVGPASTRPSSPDRVHVREDPGRGLRPGPNAPGPRNRLEPQGGYGLLVDRLAHGWGRDRVEGGGSLAWFELQLDPTDHI